MGLSASQARFLGITLRKANCEFKSTELAQQRLELTNQMTDISQEYANALNATKLVWHNEAVCDSFGNPMDYGLSYSLMMMPSAANDYNPYMFSTRSGAIVLNSKYRAAAEAAGISMAGGTPTPEGRNEFLKSLSNSTNIDGVDQHDNVITQTTYNILTGAAMASGDVTWHYSAGMGAAPKNKGVADITNLVDLQMDDDIGGRALDWLQIERGLSGLGLNEAMTEAQYKEVMSSYKDDVAQAKLKYINAPEGLAKTSEEVNNLIKNAESQATNLINKWKALDAGSGTNEEKVKAMKVYAGTPANATGTTPEDIKAFDIIGKFAYLEAQIEKSQNEAQRLQFMNELEKTKMGLDDLDENGEPKNADSVYKNPLYWSVYEQTKASLANTNNSIAWSDSTGTATRTADFDTMFQTSSQSVGTGTYTSGSNSISQLTVVLNDVICKDKTEIKSMTISDLISQNIVLMARGSNAIDSVSKSAGYLMEYIASVFGYGHIGTGLNVDTESDAALNMALASVQKQFLKAGNAVKNGGNTSDSSMLSNSAYVNANKFNRIGATDNGNYAAVNISNMLSAFLTYFDNYLRGSDSQYVVGRSNDAGSDYSRTYFVTDDSGYAYVTNTQDEITNDEKIADFFNELYNNICAHGWRYDDMVQDSEYLESAVKDGRYQIMALNNDGYFYQMRYNEIGYMEEVQDEDAIARAESDYQVKKAQITFKEDQIDVKTKKLDAEISELTTEINSVQNIISKAIEKTFTMFSN